MYCLPRRSERYDNLQVVMDEAMDELEYSAPVAGENQQIVQMADLSGDGNSEIILFAKGNDIDQKKVFLGFKNHIPKYMFPTKIVILEEMPMSKNFKIDRQRLLAMAKEL